MTTMPSRSVLLVKITKFSRLDRNGAHRLHGVIDQVEHHLLELDTVSFDRRQSFAQRRDNGDAVLTHLALGEHDDLTDRFVDLKGFLPLRRFRDEGTDTPEDLARSLQYC